MPASELRYAAAGGVKSSAVRRREMSGAFVLASTRKVSNLCNGAKEVKLVPFSWGSVVRRGGDPVMALTSEE